jgi:hypothetical protein
MKNKKEFECITCKRTATIDDGSYVPVCCSKQMRKMPREICLQPAHAEHARPMEKDEPCDDGRAG